MIPRAIVVREMSFGCPRRFPARCRCTLDKLVGGLTTNLGDRKYRVFKESILL